MLQPGDLTKHESERLAIVVAKTSSYGVLGWSLHAVKIADGQMAADPKACPVMQYYAVDKLDGWKVIQLAARGPLSCPAASSTDAVHAGLRVIASQRAEALIKVAARRGFRGADSCV